MTYTFKVIHYCLLMYLKTLEINVLIYYVYMSAPRLAWKACLKKTEVELELLTDNDMSLMVEGGIIRDGISQAVYRYARDNNTYMNNYDKRIDSSYLMYLDANNLYGWAMSQKLSVNNFKWLDDVSKLNDSFIKNYNENNDEGYILEVDVEYRRQLFNLHKDFPFLPKREICKKLICSIESKEKYVAHIKALKQALTHGLKLKKVHRVIQFNQKAWLISYISMNTKLKKDSENYFEKDFYKLMNNSVFGKTMANVRNYRDIKLVKTKRRKKRLVSEPNYHAHKKFSDNLMAIEMKKTKVKMTKSIYLGLSILDISKTLMYKLWYDYVKPKYGDRAKLCYMNTDSFVIYIKTEDFYKDIADDVERWFDTSNYDENGKRPLSIGKNKNYHVFLKMN